MSTTTKPATLTGVNADALPTGMTVETLAALMDAHGLTAKAAYALAWRDGDHGTNAEGGASMEAVFGAPVKAGGFGNTVTGALRKAGREGEVTSAPRSGGVKVTSFAEYVANYKRTMDAKREALTKTRDEAVAAVANVDTDAIVAAEGERIDKAIADLNATKKALAKDPSAFIDAHTERLRHAADAATTAHDEGIALIDTELQEAGLTA